MNNFDHHISSVTSHCWSFIKWIDLSQLLTDEKRLLLIYEVNTNVSDLRLRFLSPFTWPIVPLLFSRLRLSLLLLHFSMNLVFISSLLLFYDKREMGVGKILPFLNFSNFVGRRSTHSLFFLGIYKHHYNIIVHIGHN